MFENSKWIWISKEAKWDEYGEFFSEFEADASQKTAICISVDFDYTLFINGSFAASNQYADFEHYKIYDTVDISSFVKEGKNTVSVLVWHHGRNTQRYRYAKAGLIFQIDNGTETVLNSSEKVISRMSPVYKNGYCKVITGQLGFSFFYDASKEDGGLFNGYGFDESTVIDKNCTFFERVGEKLRFAEKNAPVTVKTLSSTHYLIDLGCETVGVPVLKFFSEKEQDITVAWGEHIIDGGVRRHIQSRDFSFEYRARAGENDYTNYMLRLGLRYLEVFASEPITVDYIGILPQYYPAAVKRAELENELDKSIYDLCVKTLKLSMMEHYVDCPWREQCLYVFDSRNQMLCGYYAFENGNREYVRSNFKLMENDTRDDGLLSLCYPCGADLAIPSFSLHLFTSLREYYEHTGDAALLKEMLPKLLSVIKVFIDNRKDGLVYKFPGDNHWNFYDWSDNLEGTLRSPEAPAPDLVLNTLFISALRSLRFICEVTGALFEYEEVLSETFEATKKAFYLPEKKLFKHLLDKDIFTVLGNSLAVITGLVEGEEAEAVCENMLSKASECSLSLKPFEYDALLMTEPERYKDMVLDEIRRNYKKMLDAGATSAWETIDGASAFSDAGSLCHGWSAIPVYYYHKFGMVK